MKGIICYYSGSGNTKLACEYIRKNIINCDFELYNMSGTKAPDFDQYDIVGLATYCDFFDVPQFFISYLDGVSQQDGKYAFVFNTFGSYSMRTLKTMKQLATAKGFCVIAGHSLHTPENYPPLRVKNFKSDVYPKQKDHQMFDEFITDMDKLLGDIRSSVEPEPRKISVGLSNIIPKLPRKSSKRSMGEQLVDEAKCVKCGLCEKKCAYSAIKIAPFPVFDHDKCYGCWACYNICPKQAIYTDKLRDVGHYKQPNRHMLDTKIIN